MSKEIVKFVGIERQVSAKASRDAAFTRRLEAEWKGQTYVAWMDIAGEVGVQLRYVEDDKERNALVEGFYKAGASRLITSGELQPGRSNVHYALDADHALPGEIVILDALPRLLALKPAA